MALSSPSQSEQLRQHLFTFYEQDACWMIRCQIVGTKTLRLLTVAQGTFRRMAIFMNSGTSRHTDGSTSFTPASVSALTKDYTPESLL